MKTNNFSIIFPMFFFLQISKSFAQVGGIGINTNNPKATLHVAGTIRTDSAKTVTTTKRFAVLDSVGVIQSLDVDSVKKIIQSTTAPLTAYYAENESIAGTNQGTLQTRTSLTLQSGTYLLQAQCEVSSAGYLYSTLVVFTDGSQDIAYAVPFSMEYAYSPWFTMKQVTISTPKTFYLQWGARNGAWAYIRAVRISAIRIQ